MTTDTKPKTLVQKLAEVAAAVDRIPKRGRNEHFGYDYVTEADIAEAVRKELASRGLVMFPDVQGVEWRESKSGSPICLLNVKWTIKDGESDDEITYHVPGAGQDAGDKGPYKALTGSQKYALLKLLQIPTGDDPEREDAQHALPAGRRRPIQKQGYALNAPVAARQAEREAVAQAAPAAPGNDLLPDHVDERKKIVADVQRVAQKLKLSQEDASTYKKTYLGAENASLLRADMAALVDMLNALRARAQESNWGTAA